MSAGVPGLLMLIGGIILPDSPASLVERGHLVKARKVCTCLGFRVKW